MKEIQDSICWSSEISARGNFPKLIEINKNLKRSSDRPKIDQSCFTECLFYKFGWNNQNLCFWKIFIVAYFTIDASYAGGILFIFCDI